MASWEYGASYRTLSRRMQFVEFNVDIAEVLDHKLRYGCCGAMKLEGAQCLIAHRSRPGES